MSKGGQGSPRALIVLLCKEVRPSAFFAIAVTGSVAPHIMDKLALTIVCPSEDTHDSVPAIWKQICVVSPEVGCACGWMLPLGSLRNKASNVAITWCSFSCCPALPYGPA